MQTCYYSAIIVTNENNENLFKMSLHLSDPRVMPRLE
jgi:hypothetical protein